MALCSLCETTCANLILCVPFAPKALNGFKQTAAFTGLKSYMSYVNLSNLKSGGSSRTYTNNPSGDYTGNKRDPRSSSGSGSITKPKDAWPMMSRDARSETAFSVNSQTTLHEHMDDCGNSSPV